MTFKMRNDYEMDGLKMISVLESGGLDQDGYTRLTIANANIY